MNSTCVKITWSDGSFRDVLIDNNYMPLVNDLLHRIEQLQRHNTCVMATEEELYDVKIDYSFKPRVDTNGRI